MTEGYKSDGLECTEGLPEGAEFVRVVSDSGACGHAKYGDAIMVFQHESFDDVPLGGTIPNIPVTFMTYHRPLVEKEERIGA
jgi:hypothetical protein